MKTKTFFAVIILLSITSASFSQKALPIQVNSLLAKVPQLENCATSFKMCTIDSNSEGLVSVKDAGPVVNGIQDRLTKNMTDLGNSSMNSSYTNASVPSQDQINQAMQNATQMQAMSRDQLMQMAQNKQNHTAPPSTNNNAALMKEFGQAQNAAGQLSILQGELATKASQLGGEYQRKMNAVPTVMVTCQDYKVQGADIALPKCDCVKALYLAYYQKRVAVEDEYLQKLNELLQNYLPKFKDQIGIIDKAENDLNYGDTISIPAFKRQVVGVQQQAFSSLLPLLGIVGNSIKDSGSEYTGIVNINNGHLPTPCR